MVKYELPGLIRSAIGRWINDVYCDMCEGQDDPVGVAEAVMSVVDCNEPEAAKMLTAEIDQHGYGVVFNAFVAECNV